jgi:hypothetical protein
VAAHPRDSLTAGVPDAVARNRARFDQAARGRELSLDFDVLGRRVRVRLAGESLVGVLTDALRHRLLPELEICAWDEASTGVAADLRGVPILGEEREGGNLVNDPRTVVHGSQGFVALQGLDPWAVQGYDASDRTAFLWAREPALLSAWGEHTKPCLEIFHAWLADTDWQPIHGGAVGGPGGGVLLAGGTGVGKSTTVLSCVQAGWLYAGDDYLAIRTEGDRAHVENLYGSARLCLDVRDRFSEFHSAQVGTVEVNGIEKADMMLGSVLPRARFGGFPIHAILLPKIVGGPHSRLRAASPGQATMAIAATTMLFLRTGASGSFEKIAGVAETTPSYWLELGDDIDELPQLIGAEIGVTAP